MTVEKLIQKLEALRDEHGPHIEVMKRRGKISDGSTQLIPELIPVKKVRVEDSDEDPTNWTISL